MFSRDKITRDEINAIKETLKDRKKDIRDMIKLYKDMGKVINSNRVQINKNTTRIEGLLGTSAVKGLLRCDEPDRPDYATGLCPQQQEGAGRKKRKTRKRRRKKRTKKKTRRKRRKSRKRKPKRRRKKKTRKRKAGCWPFCWSTRRPRVQEPLIPQQEAPQEAPTVNPALHQERLADDFAQLKSSRTAHYQREMDMRLAARKAKQREVGGTQGGEED